MSYSTYRDIQENCKDEIVKFEFGSIGVYMLVADIRHLLNAGMPDTQSPGMTNETLHTNPAGKPSIDHFTPILAKNHHIMPVLPENPHIYGNKQHQAIDDGFKINHAAIKPRQAHCNGIHT